jgi:hypothetical protein
MEAICCQVIFVVVWLLLRESASKEAWAAVHVSCLLGGSGHDLVNA